MAEWGRKEYTKPWPSRTRVWTLASFLLTPLFLAGLLTWQYERSWTEAERLYLTDYLKSGTRGQASATASSKYTRLEAVVGKGQQRLVLDDEVEAVKGADGRYGYVLTDQGVKDGLARLQFVSGTYNDKGIYDFLGRFVFLHNPASEIELPRLPYRLPPHVLTAQEAELVLQQPDIDDPIGLRDRAILEVLYSTGMRRMEVVGLKLYDLDFDRGTILIRQGKGKKDRFVPIGDRAVAWLHKYARESRPQFATPLDTGTLFLTATGEEINRDVLTATVRAYVVQAKTGKTGACHLFRHTMATLMLEGGADVRFIQEMLGHAKLDTTQIYTRVSIRMLKQVHSASHPAAQLKREHDSEAMLVQKHIWPGDPAPTAEALFAALDDESSEEEQA